MIELENYISGKFIVDPSGYKYFKPNNINDSWSWNDYEINTLLENAAIKIGELNSFSKLVPNIDLFIQLHVTKEAVVSSRIEGTRTQIDEAFLVEDDVLPERKNDWKEVNNYVVALNDAIKQLDTKPLSTRLFKTIHKILLSSVRGENKLPGEYRTSQNWIGGFSLKDAVFVPPHQKYINDLMGDLENFINDINNNIPNLIKMAIAHYQFETIHPFLDGNGRIGRLLITLFLVDKGILKRPLLYQSAFFEKNKSAYYNKLTLVRTQNDMSGWIKYFLLGMAETAEAASNTLSAVVELKLKLEVKINSEFGKRSQKAFLLLNNLFKRPMVTINEAKDITDLSYNSANSLISEFEKIGILEEVTGNNRNRIFKFSEYLSLF